MRSMTHGTPDASSAPEPLATAVTCGRLNRVVEPPGPPPETVAPASRAGAPVAPRRPSSGPGPFWISTAVRACHPGPTLTVTGLGLLLAAGTGYAAGGAAVVALAVLTGQLSIGWSNDVLDAPVDGAAGRSGKPLVGSIRARRLLWRLAVLAAFATVPLSWLAAGWAGGTFHIAAVGAGWLYNARLSRTVVSWLPYALAFGLLPVFIYRGSPEPTWPPLWLVIAFMSLAVTAHLANALRDLDSDRAVGVGGVVARLGERATRVAAGVCAAAAGVAIGVGAVAQGSTLILILAGVIVVALFAVTALVGRTWYFRSLLVIAGAAGVLLLLLAP